MNFKNIFKVAKVITAQVVASASVAALDQSVRSWVHNKMKAREEKKQQASR